MNVLICFFFGPVKRPDENNYTLKKGKKCNEKSFSYHAYTNAGVSLEVQLLLEF